MGQGCAALATRQKEVAINLPQKYINHQLRQRPCYRDFQVSVMVGKCGVSVGKCEKECATVTLEVRRSFRDIKTKCDRLKAPKNQKR